MTLETYTNLNGDDCVIVTNENGSTWSGLKSTYDEMLAQAEQSTPNLAD
jgi:hypothetical protein